MRRFEGFAAPVWDDPFWHAVRLLDITRMWFGNEHGWLTYDEAVQRGFRDELGAQPIVYPVNDDG